MVQIRRVLAAFVAAVVGSCVLAGGARAASATLYVDNTNPAATDTSNNCQTQSTPCATISHAASVAGGMTSTDVTIMVVAGSYDEAVTLEEPGSSTLMITGGPGATVTAPAGDSIFTASYPTGPITLSHLTITGADASGSGGGVEDSDAGVTLIDDTFSNDSASSGGALDTGGGNVIVGDTFVNDSSGGDGGAISNGGGIWVYDDTFVNNKAGGDGGAILTETSATIENSTFVGNQASMGGAIFNYYDATIANDIFDDGTAAGANCVDQAINGGAGVSDAGYNVADNSDCGMSTANDDIVGASDSEIGLGPLHNNGGPTETAAIGSDSAAYHLVPVAKCAPPTPKAGPQVDQRGVPRPQPPSSSFCDAGAYEYAPPAVTKVLPSSGTTGTMVTITGYGFTLADAVKFGSSLAASYTVDSDTQITATAPAGSGTVDVTVINPDGTSPTGSSDQFTYGTPTAPTITSRKSATFTVGHSGSFMVKASGNPTPSLSESGTLPSGVTFVDSGDGTATLSGTPAAKTGGGYRITITARNGVSPDATQHFKLTVIGPPGVKITEANISATHHEATFAFQAVGSATGFQCALGKRGSKPHFVSCTAPKTYKHLKSGEYVFKVRALNAAGPGSPAEKSFKIA